MKQRTIGHDWGGASIECFEGKYVPIGREIGRDKAGLQPNVGNMKRRTALLMLFVLVSGGPSVVDAKMTSVDQPLTYALVAVIIAQGALGTPSWLNELASVCQSATPGTIVVTDTYNASNAIAIPMGCNVVLVADVLGKVELFSTGSGIFHVSGILTLSGLVLSGPGSAATASLVHVHEGGTLQSSGCVFKENDVSSGQDGEPHACLFYRLSSSLPVSLSLSLILS